MKKGYKKYSLKLLRQLARQNCRSFQVLSGNPNVGNGLIFPRKIQSSIYLFLYLGRQNSMKKAYEAFNKHLDLSAQEHCFDPIKDVRGIVLETFQGWGALFYPQSYIDAIKDFTKSSDTLVCFDEMQAGFGRTGKLFGYQHYDIQPDLIRLW